jgi:SAM-dependent methyltransferase
MEELPHEPQSVDLALAVDSLYWVEDLEDFLRRVAASLTPGGVFLCLSSEFADPGPWQRLGRRVRLRGPAGGGSAAGEDVPDTLRPGETAVGAALAGFLDHGSERSKPHPRAFSLETVDFTAEEREIWRRTPVICRAWEEPFRREGRFYLLRNLEREADYLMPSVREVPGARYLFILRRGNAVKGSG